MPHRSQLLNATAGTASASQTATRPNAGYRTPMFFFFSNRLGCLGSLAVSVIGTLVLLLVLGVIHLD
jgi:hypothetical protein